MRKIFGYCVMSFPFVAFFAFLFAINWALFVFILCAIILMIDIGLWFCWFYLAGKSIVENEKSAWVRWNK